MKRFLKLFSIVLMVFVLTGCVKQNIHMDITNSEVKISVTDAMNSSLRDETAVAELKAQYEELGYTVEDYDGSKDGYVGVVYSKTYKLSDVSGDDAVEFHLETIGTEDFKDDQMFKLEKGIFGNTYRATFIFDTTAASIEGFDEDDISENASSFDISYTVTLPSKAKSHNADSVDGNTYTWNVEYGEKAEINYVFSTMSLVTMIIIGVVAIVVVGIIVLVIVKMVKKHKNNLPPTEGIPTAVPVQPGMPVNNSANYIMPNAPVVEQPTPVVMPNPEVPVTPVVEQPTSVVVPNPEVPVTPVVEQPTPVVVPNPEIPATPVVEQPKVNNDVN